MSTSQIHPYMFEPKYDPKYESNNLSNKGHRMKDPASAHRQGRKKCRRGGIQIRLKPGLFTCMEHFVNFTF